MVSDFADDPPVPGARLVARVWQLPSTGEHQGLTVEEAGSLNILEKIGLWVLLPKLGEARLAGARTGAGIQPPSPVDPSVGVR